MIVVWQRLKFHVSSAENWNTDSDITEIITCRLYWIPTQEAGKSPVMLLVQLEWDFVALYSYIAQCREGQVHIRAVIFVGPKPGSVGDTHHWWFSQLSNSTYRRWGKIWNVKFNSFCFILDAFIKRIVIISFIISTCVLMLLPPETSLYFS